MQGLYKAKLPFKKFNKFANLQATLVQNYDPPA